MTTKDIVQNEIKINDNNPYPTIYNQNQTAKASDKDIFKESNHINSESSTSNHHNDVNSKTSEIFLKKSLTKPVCNNIQFPALFNNEALSYQDKQPDSPVVNQSIYVTQLDNI